MSEQQKTAKKCPFHTPGETQLLRGVTVEMWGNDCNDECGLWFQGQCAFVVIAAQLKRERGE